MARLSPRDKGILAYLELRGGSDKVVRHSLSGEEIAIMSKHSRAYLRRRRERLVIAAVIVVVVAIAIFSVALSFSWQH
jgi:hypothetical protein